MDADLTCPNCGRRSLQFHVDTEGTLIDCANCAYVSWLPDYNAEKPESEWCVMCGREWGTAKRKDGKFYCDRCWQIWNS